MCFLNSEKLIGNNWKTGDLLLAVTFSPDGKHIAAGDEAYLVTVYDLEGNSAKVLQHDAGFDGIIWSPDEKTFAVSGAGNQLQIFSYPEAKELRTIDLPAYLEAVAYHPEGNFIFAGGQSGTMYVFNTATYAEVATYPIRRIEYIDFSKDGRLMAIGQEDSGLLSLYLVHSQKYDGNYNKLAKNILKNKDQQKK